MNRPLKIIFMGTPDFALPALQTLLNSEHEVLCVYAQPPRKKGRGQQVQLSPTHQLAASAEIEVRTPVNFKDDKTVRAFERLDADVAVVAAYGLILPKTILKAPRYGCINIHGSLLPRWRGAAPVQRAIEAGDQETGVTIMQMDEGLDTGAMIAKETVPMTADTDAPALADELAQSGARLLLSVLETLKNEGTIEKTAQPATGVTYAHKLKKDEAFIDWNEKAAVIERRLRAFKPWPGQKTILLDGKTLKLIEAEINLHDTDAQSGTVLKNGYIQCGKSQLKIIKAHPESKNVMDVEALYNGGYLAEGMVLGKPS